MHKTFRLPAATLLMSSPLGAYAADTPHIILSFGGGFAGGFLGALLACWLCHRLRESKPTSDPKKY
jgi:hypothetical protein